MRIKIQNKNVYAKLTGFSEFRLLAILDLENSTSLHTDNFVPRKSVLVDSYGILKGAAERSSKLLEVWQTKLPGLNVLAREDYANNG